MKVLLRLVEIIDSSKDMHRSLYEASTVSKPPSRPITNHLYLGDPLHFLKVQSSQILAERLASLISFTSVASEKDEQRLITYTGLPFQLGLELHGADGGLPSPLGDIEDMIVLEHLIVIASIDEHFIAIDCDRMEGAAIRHNLLAVSALKPRIDHYQRIIELVARFTWLS